VTMFALVCTVCVPVLLSILCLFDASAIVTDVTLCGYICRYRSVVWSLWSLISKPISWLLQN